MSGWDMITSVKVDKTVGMVLSSIDIIELHCVNGCIAWL